MDQVYEAVDRINYRIAQQTATTLGYRVAGHALLIFESVYNSPFADVGQFLTSLEESLDCLSTKTDLTPNEADVLLDEILQMGNAPLPTTKDEVATIRRMVFSRLKLSEAHTNAKRIVTLLKKLETMEKLANAAWVAAYFSKIIIPIGLKHAENGLAISAQ